MSFPLYNSDIWSKWRCGQKDSQAEKAKNQTFGDIIKLFQEPFFIKIFTYLLSAY